MSKIIDLTGQKFGKLIVIKQTPSNRWGHSRWLCECICKQKTTVCGGSLKSGNTKSCGCLVTKHGHSRKGRWSKVYKSWTHMIQRCTNPNNERYRDYGGRGITICRRWMIFENFLKDMGEQPQKHQLDRIDNDGNYCKKNCRWATRKQQAGNKRNNIVGTYKGKTQLVARWAEEFNIKYTTLRYRLCVLGWSIERALTTPIRKRRK